MQNVERKCENERRDKVHKGMCKEWRKEKKSL